MALISMMWTFFLTTILHQLSQVPLEGSQGSIQEENRTLGQEWLNNHTPVLFIPPHIRPILTMEALDQQAIHQRLQLINEAGFSFLASNRRPHIEYVCRSQANGCFMWNAAIQWLSTAVQLMGGRATLKQRYTFHSRPSEDMVSFNLVASTYDHRVWRTGLPVRSAVLKPHAGQLVLWWVTTWES
ncbi:hypothetical protein N7470_005668 [Penicillium chermesinum]|nr:hypothetical protein N7470_005668 [Penicillium chermesinum]